MRLLPVRGVAAAREAVVRGAATKPKKKGKKEPTTKDTKGESKAVHYILIYSFYTWSKLSFAL